MPLSSPATSTPSVQPFITSSCIRQALIGGGRKVIFLSPPNHSKQVVSGCEGGMINVWDVESGSHVLRLLESHEKNELTAMSLDVSGRRLITGSRAGDIKVRDVQGPVSFLVTGMNAVSLATLVTS